MELILDSVRKSRLHQLQRMPPSSYADGEKVSDAICEWLEQRFAIGRPDEDEIPFVWIKVSCLMRPAP